MAEKYILSSCVWELTLACCFSCKYCGSSGGRARKDELSTGECVDVARQLHELGCRRVSLIGGEVFMRRDWEAIVKALTSRGIKTCIITNGWLFSRENIRALKNTGIESVAVSLDSPRQVHDRYRQKGSFARAVKAIRELSENQIPVTVISTLNHENTKMLPKFYDFLKRLPIRAWQLQACSPMGNAAISGVDHRFDFVGVLRFVREQAPKSPFPIYAADNIGYYTPEEGYVRGSLSGKTGFCGCSGGIHTLGIDSVGNVRGCESMYADDFIEGNLRQKTLRQIWEDPNAFAYNRKFSPELLTGKCASCSFGGICRGGCRSYNYFVHWKLYESPCCPREKEEF